MKERKENAHYRVYNQGKGTHADYWPQQSTDNKWLYMTTPLLPNVLPLPGREQDNQRRWVSECEETLPWYQELLDEQVEYWEETGQTISQSRLAAIKKLTSVAYLPRREYKSTLLRIMCRPLMQHKYDFRNDAVRVAALTIDIRQHQEFLMAHTGLAERGVSRALVLLQKQRTTVLDRLRTQDFELYCNALDRFNIEHNGIPILNKIARVNFTERIISMKLRTMKQIELNIERDRIENTRLMMLCDQGEALYEQQMAQQTGDEMSFKRASENAKVIARNRDEINLMITAMKSKIDRKHVLSTTLNATLRSFKKTCAVADKGITTEELASSVLDSLNAVSDALVTIESRYKTIDEIESKFDEVIENMNELKKLTRFKGVLQDLCKRATEINSDNDSEELVESSLEFLKKFEIFEDAKNQLENDIEQVEASLEESGTMEENEDKISNLLNQSLTLLQVCDDLTQYKFE